MYVCSLTSPTIKFCTIDVIMLGKGLIVCACLSQDLAPKDAPIFLLALYEKVTLSRASTLPSMQLTPEVC